MNRDALIIDTSLEHIFEHINQLPVFPKVVFKALKLLDDPDANLRELADLIRYDQGLNANFLRLANSARFGLSRQVTRLDMALALLGIDQIKEVLLVSAAKPYLDKPLQGYGMSGFDLWTHSLAITVVSEVFSRKMGILDSTTLFTASLMHDIGKVAMNVQIGLKNYEIMQLVHHEHLSFNDAEWKVVGGDHAVVGSEILRQWEFPFEIVRAVRNHHDPDLYIQDELSLWLSSCNIITTLMGLSYGLDTFMYKIHPDLPKKLGLTYDFLFDVLQDSVTEFEKTRDMLYL